MDRTPERKTRPLTRAEELAEWKRERECKKQGIEYVKQPQWNLAFTPSKGLGELNGRPVSVLTDATNTERGPAKRKGDAPEHAVAPPLRTRTDSSDDKENAHAKESAHGTHAKESARGTHAKESAHGTHAKESARGTHAKESARGTHAKESAHGTHAKESARGTHAKESAHAKEAAAPRRAQSRASGPRAPAPKAAPAPRKPCVAPPEFVAKLEALSKKLPRDEKWKTDCEQLMAVDNLHSASAFWVVRSQYGELLRPRSEQAIKAVVTPIVLGLEGGAQPVEPLRHRALRLVKRLHGDWKKVRHAHQMAGQLKYALRKTFKCSQYASNVAPAAKPGQKMKLEFLQSFSPERTRHEILAMSDGSPGSANQELEHLYMDADWTEPEQDTWAHAGHIDPSEVAEAESALEAAVASGCPLELDRAIQDAEAKNVVSEAVDVAKRVLVAAMRGTDAASDADDLPEEYFSEL